MAGATGAASIEGARDLRNLAELERYAKDLADFLKRAQSTSPRILLELSGPMGAGKTTLTQKLIAELGESSAAHPTAASPSFAVHHRYLTAAGPVDHLDLFRIESEDDLESIGFWDFFSSKSGLIIIEWADRINELGLSASIPSSWLRIAVDLQFVAGAEARRMVTTV